MRVRIARHPLKGGISNRNSDQRWEKLPKRRWAKSKGPASKSRDPVRRQLLLAWFGHFTEVGIELTRRSKRGFLTCYTQGSGSKSFRGKPFFPLLSISLLWILTTGGYNFCILHKGLRHDLQFIFPSGSYQIIEKVPGSGTNILLQLIWTPFSHHSNSPPWESQSTAND